MPEDWRCTALEVPHGGRLGRGLPPSWLWRFGFLNSTCNLVSLEWIRNSTVMWNQVAKHQICLITDESPLKFKSGNWDEAWILGQNCVPFDVKNFPGQTPQKWECPKKIGMGHPNYIELYKTRFTRRFTSAINVSDMTSMAWVGTGIAIYRLLSQISTNNPIVSFIYEHNSLYTISVAWNNCFRRIFKCCWRDSTKPLQFFCKTMSIAHLIDQRKMIFWQNN